MPIRLRFGLGPDGFNVPTPDAAPLPRTHRQNLTVTRGGLLARLEREPDFLRQAPETQP